MNLQKIFNRIGNPINSLIFRFPLHVWFSRQVLVVGVTGKKTGKVYTGPANCLQQGNILIIILRRRSWGRNLGTETPVTVIWRGITFEGKASLNTDSQYVKEGFLNTLRYNPRLARYQNIGLDVKSQPVDEDIIQAAVQRVLIKIIIPAEIPSRRKL